MRRDVASRAYGRVLELGFGVGANWQDLPDGITYVGIEPDPNMIRRSSAHPGPAGLTPERVQALAEQLPFRDGCFDTVLVTLTLCTVDDQARSLSEVRRVLANGGMLLYSEHVRPSGKLGGRLVDLVTPAWKRLGAGCHPNRRTAEAISAAGFQPERVKSYRLNGLLMIQGAARKA
jgi:SAM-dependent methyltransferase